VVPAVAAKYPKLSVQYREAKTEEVVRDLAGGSLDAAILAVEAEIGDCAWAEIGRDDFVAALPKGHPLARKERLREADLEGARVLLLDEGHCFRTQALSICHKAHAMESSFRATSLATLTQMVSTGMGITLLPSIAVPVENRGEQLEIRPFADPVPGRTVALAWRPNAPFGEALKQLVGALRWSECPPKSRRSRH